LRLAADALLKRGMSQDLVCRHCHGSSIVVAARWGRNPGPGQVIAGLTETCRTHFSCAHRDVMTGRRWDSKNFSEISDALRSRSTDKSPHGTRSTVAQPAPSWKTGALVEKM
jgi:hypothetical protein